MISLDKSRHLYSIVGDEGGIVFQWKNNTDVHQDINYACITSPVPVYVEVLLDWVPFDGVYVGPGSSHSWWTQAGGKILDHNGLDPNETLTITSTGPCALRIDWI